MEMSGQLHAPATLPQRKSPWYPLDRKRGGPQSHSGHSGEEKNSQHQEVIGGSKAEQSEVTGRKLSKTHFSPSNGYHIGVIYTVYNRGYINLSCKSE
jgi:hypothetical protein